MKHQQTNSELFGGRSDRRLGYAASKRWGYEAEPSLNHEPISARRTRSQQRRFLFFVGLASLAGCGLFLRLALLQVARGAELRAAAEENRIRLQPIPASRGVIYDRHGIPLVRNVPNETLQIVPADLPKGESELQPTAASLAAILNEPPAQLLDEMREKREVTFQSFVFREHLSYQTALKLRLIESQLPGFHVEVTATREYLGGDALSHLLGYTGKINSDEAKEKLAAGYQLTDQTGKSGLELSYESTLRGKNGRKQIEVDSLGKEKRIVASAAPELGENLYLSIDADLQRRASEALSSMVAKTRSRGGALVAIDPRNGEILALASAPTFDNNLFTQQKDPAALAALFQDERNPLFFRPTDGQYPSGSTMKPFVASAALSLGVITPTTTVNSTGGIRVGQWFFPDWQSGGHGITNVRKAIAQSVNTFFYMVGGGGDGFQGLGVSRLVPFLARFGFGQASGIDLPGEAIGLLPTPEWKEETKNERWYIGDTYHLAIGQGDVLVTPLQMAVATAAIANGGTVYQPRLVTTVEDAAGRRSALGPQTKGELVASSQTLAVVREGMRDGVLDGSSRAMQSLPVSSAGKTGTAQFGNGSATHAWFTAFAPYEDPTLAIAVVVESGGEGHAAALPVARDVIAAYFERERPPRVDK
ncbi:MAG: penicillin-binding protein 2 [Candidatus Kerfeldbacteria bacterium]|nr:penicillin-binding protein 2 [Candidatus Kerfeldbacteria bacterium]